MKTFGSRLRGLRESRRWSQEKLGFELGVTKATVSKWESDSVDPSLSTLLKVKAVFADESVTLDFLCGEPGSRRGTLPAPGLRVSETDDAEATHSHCARSREELQLLFGFRGLSRIRQKALLKLLTEDA